MSSTRYVLCCILASLICKVHCEDLGKGVTHHKAVLKLRRTLQNLNTFKTAVHELRNVLKEFKQSNLIEKPKPLDTATTSIPSNTKLQSTYYKQEYLNKISEWGYKTCKDLICKPEQFQNRKFDKQNMLIVPANAGILKAGCGPKQYLLTSQTGEYPVAWTVCCQYGMVPTIIQTSKELQCVTDLFKAEFGLKKPLAPKAMWTGYFDLTLRREFVACPSHHKLQPASLLWFSGEPNNGKQSETCVSLNCMTRGDCKLNDISCFIPYYIFCQYNNESFVDDSKEEKTNPPFTITSSKVTDTEKLETKANVASPYAPSVVKKFALTDGKDPCRQFTCNNKAPAKIHKNGVIMGAGIVLPPCGNKRFFVSSILGHAELDTIGQMCCRLGATVVTLETEAERACLISHYNKLPASVRMKATNFGVGLMDVQLDRSFLTCPNLQKIPANMWMPGEPNNAGNKENCVVISLGNDTGYLDVPCEWKLRYLCQFIVN